jgi:hypothetical protein
MKKVILDRISYLKSQLREESKKKFTNPTKRVDEEKIISLLSRIDELKRLLL